jgi:hypothetical protein
MGTATQGQAGRSDSDVRDNLTESEPSRDDLFHVLRNHRRRYAIHYLKHESNPADVGTLATQVAAWENDVEVEEVTSQQRRRVYNALQQTHVPELEATGLVEVDRRDVELTERATHLDFYLEVVPRKDIPWSEYYLALGGVGLAAITVLWLDVGPFGSIPDINAGIFLSATLLASALVNYHFQRNSLLGQREKPPELRG